MRRRAARFLFALFVACSFLISFAQAGETNKTALLKIDGITWAFCVPALQALLIKIEGVGKTDVDWQKGEVVVEYDPSKVNPPQMVQAVNQSGVFKVKAVENFSGRKGSNNGADKKKSR